MPQKSNALGEYQNCKKEKKSGISSMRNVLAKKSQSPSACHRVRLVTHRIINLKAFPNTETPGRYLKGNFEMARSLQRKFQTQVH